MTCDRLQKFAQKSGKPDENKPTSNDNPKIRGDTHPSGGVVTRNRQSAKKAGTVFETLIANTLRDALGDDTIQRAPNWGAVDKGDIVNVKIGDQKLVIQCKDVAKTSLPAWTEAAKVQSVNANALCGIVVHKRHGTANPMKQWVSCTMEELVALITGVRQYTVEDEGN